MPSSSKPILLIDEAPSEQEARTGSSFVGPSGAELIRMLGESGILSLTFVDRDYISKYYTEQNPIYLNAVWNLHPEVFRTNVFQFHPPNLVELCGAKAEGIPGYPPLLKSKYVLSTYQSELDRLGDEILAHDPNIIICLGNTALWAMSGYTTITKYRGTTLISTRTVSGYKLLVTYQPSAVCRNWDLRPTVIADLMKAKRESSYPEIRRPHREIWIEPEIEDVRRFHETYIRGCDILSVDIETSGSRVTCIGFAPSISVALVIPFDDFRRKDGNYWSTREAESECWRIIQSILMDASVPKLFQNGMYDIAFLYRAYGIKIINAAEDTMLLHHALQPEALKSLGFLGSVYSDEGSWKHMRKHETIKRDD